MLESCKYYKKGKKKTEKDQERGVEAERAI